MATAASLVSIDEYMHTSYSPDCEYIDGVIVERNVGKGKHAPTQGNIYYALRQRLLQKAFVLPEQRVRISKLACVFLTYVS